MTRARFMNLKKTTDILTYETPEKRALHCAAVHNQNHDGDERLEYESLHTEPSTLATMSGGPNAPQTNGAEYHENSFFLSLYKYIYFNQSINRTLNK